MQMKRFLSHTLILLSLYIVYAVVRLGARQYRAEVGDAIVVERLRAEVGEQVDDGRTDS